MTVSISNLNFTWANSSNIFTAIGANVNASAYEANSKVIKIAVNGNNVFDIDASGNVELKGNLLIKNTVSVSGNASVNGNVSITGNISVLGSVTSNLSVTGTTSDSKGNLRDLPVTSKSQIYYLSLSDTGKIISTTANVYIPNTIFSSGQAVSVFNSSAVTINIVGNSNVSLILAGYSNNANKLLSANGLATIVCLAANTFVVSGIGVT